MLVALGSLFEIVFFTQTDGYFLDLTCVSCNFNNLACPTGLEVRTAPQGRQERSGTGLALCSRSDSWPMLFAGRLSMGGRLFWRIPP
jgi:hypothetical protein